MVPLMKINCRSISIDSYLNDSVVLSYQEGACLIEYHDIFI